MQSHLKLIFSHVTLAHCFSRHLSLLTLTYLFLSRNIVMRTENLPVSFTTVFPIARIPRTQKHPNVLLNEFPCSFLLQTSIATNTYLLFSVLPGFVLTIYFLNFFLTFKFWTFPIIWILQMSNLPRSNHIHNDTCLIIKSYKLTYFFFSVIKFLVPFLTSCPNYKYQKFQAILSTSFD